MLEVARNGARPAGRARRAWLAILMLAVSALPCRAQDEVEQAKGLIVKIEAEFDGESEAAVGAGIVFALDGTDLYVVTANHVVRRGRRDVATVVRVTLHDSSDPLEAELLEPRDRDLDIATLRAALTGTDAERRFDFDRLGAAEGLERGDEVWHVGHAGHDWQLNVRGDPVARHTGSRVYFETRSVDEGHSGGGVFDEDLQLVGMMVRTSAAEGQAIEIETVVEYLEDWGLPVDLSRPDLAVCELETVGGKVPRGAWTHYDRGRKEAWEEYPDWAKVRREMTQAIERHPSERGFNKRGMNAGRFHYLPYYYLGLALYKEAGDCSGWSCAWDISLDLGEALETEEGSMLADYRDECRPAN